MVNVSICSWPVLRLQSWRRFKRVFYAFFQSSNPIFFPYKPWISQTSRLLPKFLCKNVVFLLKGWEEPALAVQGIGIISRGIEIFQKMKPFGNLVAAVPTLDDLHPSSINDPGWQISHCQIQSAPACFSPHRPTSNHFNLFRTQS